MNYIYYLLLIIINLGLIIFLIYKLLCLQKQIKSLSKFENTVSHEAEKIMEEALDKITEGSLKKVEDEAGQLTELTENRLIKLQSELAGQEAVLGKQYIEKMDQTWSALNVGLQKKAAEILDKFTKDAGDYKSGRIAGLNKEISAMVFEISTKVLNKSIRVDEQNELIISALEQAKKEGLLDF